MNNDEQRRIFREQLLSPVVREYPYKDQLLCGFMALEGAEYAANRKLMVVGRAVNGWRDSACVSNLVTDEQKDSFIDSIFWSDQECKLAWVEAGAGSHNDYNTNRSAFWRVIKAVSRSLGVWGEDNDWAWSSGLVWSNLYKISPHAGGNPSDRLCALQEEGCIRLLRQELLDYAPERVLLLTGMPWAWNFMKGLGCRLQATQGVVEAHGLIDLPDARLSIPFVVASHPQGKCESSWVEAVLEAFQTQRPDTDW